jgi:uncharacterized FlaG/YvyC family protein
MSELDLDIRTVASASYGARNAASDLSQVQAASDASSSQAAQTVQASQVGQAGQSSFRYDSFRFVYAPTYGRIVLIDQNPETGKAISQIPSQRALQIYAEQRRIELQTETASTTPAPATSQSKATTTVGTGGSVASGAGTSFGRRDLGGSAGQGGAITPTATQAAPSVAPTPSDIPSPAFVLQSFAPVNITI